MKSFFSLCVFSVLLLAIAPRAISASFDCAKASGTTESLICKNADISALDDKLQAAYKAARVAVAPFNKPELLKEQRDWIKYTRNICQDADCLKLAYSARIAVLARNEKYIVDKTACETPNSNKDCVNVVSYRDPAIRIDSFNQSLAAHKKNGKIIGCSKLVNLPVGHANSNNSFGGICTLQDGAQRQNVTICNDDMVGHFAMQPTAPQDIPGKNLIDFTYDNCFGG
jgi:uncharacterized protein